MHFVFKKLPEKSILHSSNIIALLFLGMMMSRVLVGLPTQSSTGVSMELLANESLAVAPKNALVLLNGDLETNIPMYYHYCEGFRKDLTLLSMNHLTYDWFEDYKALYATVTFPKGRYHPTFGYNLRDLISANMENRSITIFGNIVPGDHSFDIEDGFEFKRLGLGFEVRKAPPSSSSSLSLTECDSEFNQILKTNPPANISISSKALILGTWQQELLVLVYRMKNANTAKALVALASKCPFPEFQSKLMQYCVDIFTHLENYFDLFSDSERAEMEDVFKFCYSRNQELCPPKDPK
jgi:hypothetical protein